ncbi:Serine/threonine-protein kinase PknA [Planctomycetes bacterium Poly30]|uniref:Serine/threonine-protein kinase PknA n=2 Tax=Saltatorellus ferox TaxID=2528018 RepID=A0A518EYS7_9BACT|nr:Serine/threonine-protein kinase PknA [Planctomycetes bacterium Poly30]
MRLARQAVELDHEDRLGWVLRCHREFEVVERVLRLVLSFDDHADDLGVALAVPQFPQESTLPLPTLIDRFRILELLGAGAFSRVYRALDEISGEQVALKVLHLRSESDEATTRFQREIEVLSSLRHDAIARFVDAGETKDDRGLTRWIALELVEGDALREAAKGRDMRWLAKIAAQVARAIQYAHDAGVVHRDLKPSNVMVTDDGRVKVLDFGIAALRNRGDRNRLTTTGQVLGTIAYMAPEQVAGHKADTPSDQFSLAAMLFEAATGKLPHGDGEDGWLGLFSIAAWDGSIDPVLLAKLPTDLATILQRALDSDPALRFPSLDAFADELDRWRSGKKIRTTRPGWSARARRFVRRNRRPVAAGLAAIAVLSSALVVTASALAMARKESARAQAAGDQALLPLLLEEVAQLWPREPATVPQFERWLERAEAVSTSGLTSAERIERPEERRVFTAQLSELPASIDAVRTRLQEANTVLERTVQQYADEWYAAAERVHADPRFHGLELVPQIGLIPLGRDPRSEFEEFAIADIGSVPQRDSRSGDLVLEEDAAPVLVLLPGGPTKFGTAWIDTEDRFMHEGEVLSFADAAEFGFRDVDLDPFLIGKYEVTQYQWEFITGTNPSEWRAGEENYGRLMTALHPVETISYAEAVMAAERIGCTLPTEAQWQYAAAPVDRGLYWWPENEAGTTPLENLNPKDSPTSGRRPWYDDPYSHHAPVGTFAPNPNGLHDILGNVQERCLDHFKVAVFTDPSIEVKPGTGEVMTYGGGDRSTRGGNYHAGFYNNTIARRYGPTEGVRVGHLGARFARTLRRE